MEDTLSTQAIALYSWIVEYKRTHDGNTPKMREIMEGLNYRSTSPVSHHLEKLSSAGWLEVGKGHINVGGRWIPPRKVGV